MLATESLAQKALAISLGLFLFGQLFVGGNTLDVVLLSAGWSVAVLLLAICVQLSGSHRARAQGALVAALLGVSLLAVSGIVGLTTLPSERWQALPGHDFYINAERVLRTVIGDSTPLAISLDPPGTVRALLALAPAFAIFVAGSLLKRSLLLKVLGVSVVIAVAQAVFGIVQIGFGTPTILSLDTAAGGNRASGTFINKNHYATLLAMHLPLVLMRAAGQFTFFKSHDEPSTLSNVWWGVAAALIVAALVASLSRAGATAGLIVALITLALCGSRKQFHSQRIVFVLSGLLAIMLAWLSNLDRLIASMTGSVITESALGRQLMNEYTFLGAQSFWPLGAGFGSYSIAFQRFQTPELIGFIDYAHNDYAQLIFETGAVGVVVLLCFAMAGVVTAINLIKHGITATRVSPAVGCLLGAIAFAIHAWFDFPAHIPGVAMVVCLLLAASTNDALVNVRPRPASLHDRSADGPTTGHRKRHPLKTGEDTTAPITLQPNPWITRPGDTEKT